MNVNMFGGTTLMALNREANYNNWCY